MPDEAKVRIEDAAETLPVSSASAPKDRREDPSAAPVIAVTVKKHDPR